MTWAGEQEGGFGVLRAIDLAAFSTHEHSAVEMLATHTEALTSCSLNTCETTLKEGASKDESRVVSLAKSGLPGRTTDPCGESDCFKQSTSASLALAVEKAKELDVKAKNAREKLEREKCILTNLKDLKSCGSTLAADRDNRCRAGHLILNHSILHPSP